MAPDVSKLKSIDLENTVIRNPRVSILNRPTTRSIDVGTTGADASGDVYTGERDLNVDYLVQASLKGNVIKGEGNLSINEDEVTGVTGINGLEPGESIVHGDILRFDGDTSFYAITGMEGSSIYLQDKNTTFSGSGLSTFEIRKNKLNSVHYEYIKSTDSEDKFEYDKQKNRWTYTGIQPEGPFVAKNTFENGIEGDPLVFKFQPSRTDIAPDLTHVDTTSVDPQSPYSRKVLESKLAVDTSEVALSPVPYPDDDINFKVYWGPAGLATRELKEAGIDYTVNYTSDPDYSSEKPPYSERNVAYLNFLNELKGVVQVRSIGIDFQGIFTLHEEFVSDVSDEARPVTDIFPNSLGLTEPNSSNQYIGEIIKVGDEAKDKFVDYNIEYDSGIVNFIKHQNKEKLNETVLYPKSVLWDGVSVIKGVQKSHLKNQSGRDLVIPYGIKGLTGASGPIYFEDVDENVLLKDEDYTFEYGSGAFRFNKPLKPNEIVLVSYFTEGIDVEKEELNLQTMRTSKYPVIESSVSIKKVSLDRETGKTLTKILVEGVDFKVRYLSGEIVFLSTGILEDLQQIEITYTPFAQIHSILQPIPGKEDIYRITIIDDVLEKIDAFNLRFGVRNKSVSVKNEDPFGEEETVYEGSILTDSLLSLKVLGEPGFGLNDLTREQMYQLGITNLEAMGLADRLNIDTEEFYSLGITGVVTLGVESDRYQDYAVSNYSYDDENKEVSLDVTLNKDRQRADLNDTIVATYSYEAEILPYAPAQIIYPVFNEGESSFLIEGFDKTDILHPDTVIRIDSLTPENSYYFRIKSVSYDGINTTVELYGSFPEDINLPDFYVFDDKISWVSLSSDVSIDSLVSVGESTIVLDNATLSTLRKIRENSLLMIDNENIYEIQSVTLNGTELSIEIFPGLRNPYPDDLKVSPPVYSEDDTDMAPSYPLVTDPEHPAFRLYYNKSPLSVYGTATIYIDPEKITLTETVDDASYTYEYPFSNYSTVWNLISAISTTQSKAISNWNPFSIYNQYSERQYYLSSGDWSSNLIIPFDSDEAQSIGNEGFLVTITHEMFRYILIRAFKGFRGFLIEQKDRRDFFSKGQLLAFRDKDTSLLYYFEVLAADLTTEEVSYQEDPLIHTRVTLMDTFRTNLLNPIMYKYDDVSWISYDKEVISIDKNNSTITLATKPSYLKESSLIRISSSYVYQVDSIKTVGSEATLTLSPTVSEKIRRDQSIQISSYPIYLDKTVPQPTIRINYTSKEENTTASIQSDDEKLTIVERKEGSGDRVVTIEYSRFDRDLNQLASGIEYAQLSLEGSIGVDVGVWEDYFTSQGNTLKIEPVKNSVNLPYSLTVTKPAFTINYNSLSSKKISQITISESLRNIVLIEWNLTDLTEPKSRKEIPWYGRKLSDVINDINNTVSTIEVSERPWSVNGISYDSSLDRVGYYDIVPTHGEELKDFPYTVNTTENPERWSQIGILNRNVLTEDEDYTVEGTGVVLSRGILPYERYELSYLGLDSLAQDEGKSISAYCRYFYSLPKGYAIDVYMDYLNKDQFYLQKCTERRFIEIVTTPQIKQILQQIGNSVGVGNDSGSDNPFDVWDGGLIDLYYQLQDEKIKTYIYLKIWEWYKQRLRNFAAEAQIILGFKFGHSNAVGVKDNGQFSLEDTYVEDDNYTLTRESDLEQIENGFSQFFPIDYKNDSPRQYPRFGNEYRLSNEVFCYNLQYIDSNNKVEKTEGRVLGTNTLWYDGQISGSSRNNLDFDMLPYSSNTPTTNGNLRRKFVYNFVQTEDSDEDVNRGPYDTLADLKSAIESQITSLPTDYDVPEDTSIFKVEVSRRADSFLSSEVTVGSGDIPAEVYGYINSESSILMMKISINSAAQNSISNATYTYQKDSLVLEFEEMASLYIIPYDQEEKIFSPENDNFKFLKRIDAGDSLKLEDKKSFYDVGKIEQIGGVSEDVTTIYKEVKGKRVALTYDDGTEVKGIYIHSPDAENPNEDLEAGDSIEWRDDVGDNDVKIPYYRIPKDKPSYERIVLKDNKYFKEKEVNNFAVKQINGVWKYVKYDSDSKTYKEARGGKAPFTLEELELNLPKQGQTIVVKRKDSTDFPVSYPAWDDEFSTGSKAIGSKIVGHKAGTDRIKKSFSLSSLLDYVQDEDEWFTVDEGTYDEFTGEFVSRNKIYINLKYLNLREERKVSDVLDAIRYNLTGFRVPIVLPVPPFTIPPFFVKISNTFDRKDKRGTENLFYVSFEKYYDPDANATGYEEGIVFRSRDRNSWFRLGIGGNNDVSGEYGFQSVEPYTNFYYPNNLYLKLLIEKQYWLAELAMIKELFDCNNKVKRAFKLQDSPENISVSSGVGTWPLSEYQSYLSNVSSSLKTRMEDYAEHMRFLLDDSDTQNKYLVDNKSGPLYRTRMEDSANAAIITSYNQATQALSHYSKFESERLYYWDTNNYSKLIWDKDYAKWSLSLEKGSIPQKRARDIRKENSYVDIGYEDMPAISLSVVDHGDSPPFTVFNPRYRVLYNILPNTNQDIDLINSAVLEIRYTLSFSEIETVKTFSLITYSTLQTLSSAINSQCVSGGNTPVIRSSAIFPHSPYGEYSTKYLLRTYRSVPNNSKNGSDLSDEFLSISDTVYLRVGNVQDRRSYDSRVLFLNRSYRDSISLQNVSNSEPLSGHTNTVSTGFDNRDGEIITVWPTYEATPGKEILGEKYLGKIPVSGSWATEASDDNTTALQSYLESFKVIDISTRSSDFTIRDYRFLDYSKAPGQTPGSDRPRNPLFEVEESVVESTYGYNYETSRVFSETSEDNLEDIQKRTLQIPQIQPETEIIRGLKIVLDLRDPEDPAETKRTEVEIDLRKYPTVLSLVNFLDEVRYKVEAVRDSSGEVSYYKAVESEDSTGLRFFNADLIGDRFLQGNMKTIDLVTRYVPQQIYVGSHTYYPLNEEVSRYVQKKEYYDNPISVPVNESYQIGWILREEDFSYGANISLSIDPRSYSPGHKFRFFPDDPRIARANTLEYENKDILAFDIYSWDDNAAYKIENNILYLKSKTIPDGSCSISLFDDNASTVEGREGLTLIELLEKINTNSVARRKFFANLRFGRRSAIDYKYTYLPDTVLWAGGTGWVSISKASWDTVYLDRDKVFTISSEDSNSKYRIDPESASYPAVPDDDTIYKSDTIHFEADTKAIKLTPNSSYYTYLSGDYTVNQGLSILDINFSYQIDVDGSNVFTLGSYTIGTLASAINALTPFSATLTGAVSPSLSATNLVQAPNNSLPNTLVANVGGSGALAINVSMASGYSGRTYTISGGQITLNWTRHDLYNTSHSVDLSIFTTLQQVVNDINAWEPIFGNNAYNATVEWLYPGDASSSLLDATSQSIASSGTTLRMSGIYEVSLYQGGNPRSIQSVVEEINSVTDKTGFSVNTSSDEYDGYKSLDADLIEPVDTLTSFSNGQVIYADFRATPALYVLNMSFTVLSTDSGLSGGESATLDITGGNFSCEKENRIVEYPVFSSNRYIKEGLGKNLESFVDSAMSFDGTLNDPSGIGYSEGILKMDVGLFLAGGVTYGILRNRDSSVASDQAGTVGSIDLSVNDPEALNTHVYLGFLGNIRFYQISDYNIYRQYTYIKRRLGLPWDDSVSDYFVPNDNYDFSDFFECLHRRDKFLNYLKFTRFGQISDSIRFERLIQNEYLWLFLKLHREIGCDQRVIYLTKKIEEDEEKATQLQ